MDFIRRNLNTALLSRLRELKRMGIVSNEWISTSELLRLRAEISDSKNYRAMSVIAEVIKLRHAIGMIETQGVVTTNKYFERLKKEAEAKGGSKAARRLVGDLYVKRAMDRAKTLKEMHPKLLAVKNVVNNLLINKPDSRIIVFTNYRDTAELVKNVLSHVDGVRPVKFVGQAQKDGVKGLSQKQQVQLISEFVEGKYNVLVATSVAEEGLDIPSTDMVLFYEPIPSEIRSIQREGRTGRRRSGKVVVLITKGTRDEAYYWSSNRKRKIMRAEMKKMSDKASDALDEPSCHIDSDPHTLEDTPVNVQSVNYNQASDNATIGTQCSYHRENEAMNAIQITRDGPYAHEIELMVPSEKCQTTLLDFEKDITDTVRILVDVPELRYDVVDETIKLGKRSEIRTLPIVDYVLNDKIAVERKTAEDVLSTLMDRVLFEREQIETKRGPILRGKKSTKTLEEQQEYLISSIFSIGPIAAGALLKHFGSVEAVINAPEEQLVKVKGIGKITAQKIREIICAKYALESPKE
jgi:Fanconi anemia group M protein